jgi:hypothetical protein
LDKNLSEGAKVRDGAAGHVRVERDFSCAQARVGIVPHRRRDADLNEAAGAAAYLSIIEE